MVHSQHGCRGVQGRSSGTRHMVSRARLTEQLQLQSTKVVAALHVVVVVVEAAGYRGAQYGGSEPGAHRGCGQLAWLIYL